MTGHVPMWLQSVGMRIYIVAISAGQGSDLCTEENSFNFRDVFKFFAAP